MIVQCPDCQTKMRPKPPAGTPEGQRVSVKCRCGTTLRFRMPGAPKPSVAANKLAEAVASIFKDKGWPL